MKKLKASYRIFIIFILLLSQTIFSQAKGDILFGCTDTSACNYDVLATIDDGSCTFGPANDTCEGATEIIGVTTITFDNTTSCLNNADPSCGDPGIQDLWYKLTSQIGGVFIVNTTLNGTLSSNKVTFYEDPCGSIELQCASNNLVTGVSLTCGETIYVQIGGNGTDVGTMTLWLGEFESIACSDPEACFFVPCAIDETDCTYPGCTDPSAFNYDSTAGCNSTCLYSGCTYPSACNYNSATVCDDGSCLWADDCGNCGGSDTSGCTNFLAANYDSLATCDDGGCVFIPVLCVGDSNGDGLVNILDIVAVSGNFGAICPD